MTPNHAPPSVRPDITTLLVNYNTAHLFDECFGNLARASEGLNTQTIVVDNQSRDNSAAILRDRFPEIELIESGSNMGFGRANNLALPMVRGRYLLLLNTDAFVQDDTLRSTLAYMEAHPRCGILGVRLEGRAGNLQPSCRYFPTPWNTFCHRTGLAKVLPAMKMVDDMDWDHQTPRACDWVPGCYYLIREDVVRTVGLFDPRFFMYLEEVDHCRRTKQAGWEVHFFPGTTVVHIGGESARSEGELTGSGAQLKDLQVESSLLYYRKWNGIPGAMIWLLLNGTAELYDAAKMLLRGRLPAEKRQQTARNLQLLWRKARATSLGRRPTR